MNKRRAAVIGSGFGGLAAAIRLQAAGFSTTVFEKRERPGGRAYVYNEKGFTFDAGPTVITDPTCLIELFSLCGKNIKDYVTLLPVHPFYRLYWEDGATLDYSNRDSELFAEIRKFSERDLDGYKRFLQYSKRVFHEGYEKLGAVPFLSFWTMLRSAPQLIRLQAHRSVYSMVSSFVKDDHLRQAFSFHSLLVGGNPFVTSSIYTLIHHLERKWGVFFPRGGTSQLVNGLIKLFQDIGGTIELSTPVEKIMTENNRVTAVKTERGMQPFDVIVSNADVVHTYQHLLKDEASLRSEGARVSKMSHSMSLFLIYFGTRKTYRHLAHHNVLFGPRYKELLSDIFSRGILADDFSLYLHAPCVSDPSLAPAGHDTFYALSPVPHLGKSSIDWSVQGPLYAERILTYLEKRVMPDLRSNIVVKKIFTPTDFKTELNAHMGSAFSLEPTLRQSAYFRTHNRDARFSNLYFVGAGTHPGAGIPGVVSSAKATVGLVLSAS